MQNRSSWKNVRQADSARLHSLALRLRRLGWSQDLTEGQERLWRQLVAELAYRSARKRSWCKRCWCDLCRDWPSAPTVEDVEALDQDSASDEQVVPVGAEREG